VNNRRAHSAHPARCTLPPPDLPNEPITDTDTPAITARCPLLLPGTTIQCAKHLHPPSAACHATGIRDGFRWSAFWWRAT